MEVSLFVELIATLGFPIVCVIALGVFVYKLWQQSVEREKALMVEIAENRLINEKAIETIAHYASKLDLIQQDISGIKNDISVITTKIYN